MFNVSIIIPNYNGEKWLPFCLESVLNQDYLSYNIIIVDDGSTDNSVSIAEKYQRENKNITLLKNSINMGVSYSRNVGVTHSSSEYIAFTDSDDTVANTWLSEIMACVHKESLDVCGCWLTSNSSSLFRTTYTVSKKYEDIKNELWFIGGSIGGLLVKRTLCLTNPFDTQKTTNEDKEFYDSLMSSTNKISNVQKSLYHYRRHENNVTKGVSGKNTGYNPSNNLPKKYQKLGPNCITLGAPISIYNVFVSIWVGLKTLNLKNYTLYMKLLIFYIFKGSRN